MDRYTKIIQNHSTVIVCVLSVVVGQNALHGKAEGQSGSGVIYEPCSEGIEICGDWFKGRSDRLSYQKQPLDDNRRPRRPWEKPKD